MSVSNLACEDVAPNLITVISKHDEWFMFTHACLAFYDV